MRRMGALLCVAGVLMCGASFGSEAYIRWSADHAESRKALLDLFERHGHMREALADANEDAGIVSDWIEFLAAKGDRNTNDFVEKRGREAKAIKRIHEKYPEEVRAFREWIRDHEKASVELAHTREGMKQLLNEASRAVKRKRD